MQTIAVTITLLYSTFRLVFGCCTAVEAAACILVQLENVHIAGFESQRQQSSKIESNFSTAIERDSEWEMAPLIQQNVCV